VFGGVVVVGVFAINVIVFGVSAAVLFTFSL
jgi:hypothetical protein